jgi:hypothetical protein
LEERRHMIYIIEFLTIWIFAIATYYMNPLNNPANPSNNKHYLSADNVKLLKEVRNEFDGDIAIEWPDIEPYLDTFFLSLFSWGSMRLALFFLRS